MERAVARPITLAAIVVQTLQQGRKLIEAIQARDVPLFYLLSPWRSHADDYAR
jgi:hypothetical protein